MGLFQCSLVWLKFELKFNMKLNIFEFDEYDGMALISSQHVIQVNVFDFQFNPLAMK